MDQLLKIGVWNANGLCQRKHELEVFKQTEDIDIMLISETHFTKRSYFKIPNYILYDTKHPDGTAHGGTAILIKTSIDHHRLHDYQEDHLQATTIQVSDRTGSFSLSAVYSPPKHKISAVAYEEFFRNLGGRFIAGGDYNAKHHSLGCRTTNPKGQQLYICCQHNQLHPYSPNEPTYWPTDTRRAPDILDICICKGFSHQTLKITSSFDLSSDHTPIILSISTSVHLTQHPPSLFNSRTNWIKFQAILTEKVKPNIPLKTIPQVEAALYSFTSCIQEAAWDSSPTLDITRLKPVIPHGVKEKIKEKRQLRKIWQRTKHPDDKRNYNKATKNLKNLLAQEKQNKFQKFLEELKTNCQSTEQNLWKIIKRGKNIKRLIEPIRQKNGHWIRNAADKADAFAKYLQGVFQPNPQATLHPFILPYLT